MLTLPARVRRPLTRRALTALACIGALTLSSCAAHEEYSDSAPITSAATPTASVDAKTLFQTADGAWKANTVQIPLGLDAPATFDAVATPTAEPSTDAEYEAAFATSSAQTTDPGSRCGVTSLLGDSACMTDPIVRRLRKRFVFSITVRARTAPPRWSGTSAQPRCRAAPT